MTPLKEKPAILYYDGACPICSTEIERLRQASDGSLQARNIHDADASAAEDVDNLLRTLHYLSPDGEWLTGLDANVAAWQHTRWGFAWRWLNWPFVRPVASRLYDAWARLRYRRLYGQTGDTVAGVQDRDAT